MAIRAEFTRDLLTDDEMIDAQHKELFEKINALFESCEGGKGAEETMNTLNYLVDYTKFHFGAEEKLQEEIDFPDINQHKTEHRRLIEAVDDLKAKLEKEVAKVKGKYVKSQLHLEEIPAEAFTFQKPSDEE